MQNEPKETAELAELQRWLRWIITEPRGVAETLNEPGEMEPKPSCLLEVVDAPPLPRQDRLDIYAEAYFARLVDSLAKDYEAIHAVLDEDSFRRLVADYLVAYPSHTPNIGEVGMHFPHFLKSSAFAANIPYLSDLATLEWTLIEAFYARVIPRFDPTSLSAVSPEAWASMKLILHPSVTLLRLDWPVDEIWKTRHETEIPVDLSLEETHLVVFRDEFSLNVQRLSLVQWKMLDLIGAQLPLGDVLEQIQMENPSLDLAPLFRQWFTQWTSMGLIQNVEVSQ